MSTLDTLEIVLEGNASGLTSTLRHASDEVIKNVQKMNDQQVNWESILAKTISPTLITAVAGTFAAAISQYINFQNAAINLNNIGGKATNDFANSLANANGQAYTMATGAGQSIGNTATAYEAFLKAGLTSAAAQDAVNRSSQIAYATGQDYLTVVQQLVTLFNQWGVTSTPQVEKALTGLANAAKNGRFSFGELIDAISNQGPLLKAKTNISDVAINLATLSTKSNLSKATILDTFNAISGATGKTAILMNTMFGGAAKAITTGPDGLVKAFEAIKNSVDKNGILIATSFGSQVGIMKSDIMGFSSVAQKGFGEADTAANLLNKNMSSLDSITQKNTSSTAALQKAWNNFVTTISSFVLPPAVKTLTGALKELPDVAAGGVKTGAAFEKNPAKFTSDFFSAMGNNLMGIAKGFSAIGNTITFGTAHALGKAIGNGVLASERPIFSPAASTAPAPNTTNVNMSTVINMKGDTGGGNMHLLGSSIADQAYRQFQGLQ